MRGRSEAVRSAVIAVMTGALLGLLAATLGGSLLSVLAAGGVGASVLYGALVVGAVVADWETVDREDGDAGGERGPPADHGDGPR